MRISARLLWVTPLLLPSFASGSINVTTFEEDIIPTYKSISAAYGAAIADELVEKGMMDADEASGRGSSTSIELWKQSWLDDREMWCVQVYFRPNDYTETQLTTLQKGIRKFQKMSGVVKFTFLDDLPTDGTPFLHVGAFGTDRCSSYVGVDKSAYTADGQFLFLGPSCLGLGQIHHELMHALGFFHEHSRPDRDTYVTVNSQWIEEGEQINFQIASNIDSLGVAYDYKSVMHYGEFQYTSDPTQKTIDAKGKAVGQREKISWLDNVQMRLLYQCKTGSRTLAEYNKNNGKNRCNADCKCGYRKRGCALPSGVDDTQWCKGSLVCRKNKCVKAMR